MLKDTIIIWNAFSPPKILSLIDYCAVCQFPLDKKFPEDFPDEWKFCCACHACAKYIIEGETARSDIFKKIEKKITLVGK